MGANLAIKDIEFNGAMLKAAQDIEGKIWVGIRWVCQGIGFAENRIDNERKKIQKDIVISQGVKFYSLGTGNSDTKVLCLDLDYLPLWLAKISITPTMKRENPELVQKLITYQLKAKDVLAAAFLNKKPETTPAVKSAYPRELKVTFPEFPEIPDYKEEIKELKEQVKDLTNLTQSLYEGMGKLSRFLINSKTPVVINQVNAELNKGKKKKELDDRDLWKKELNARFNELMKYSRFEERNKAVKMLYDYTNNTYGICWDQQMKEYKRKHNIVGHVQLFDVIYEDPQLRSIFMASLIDKVEEFKNSYIDDVEKIIKPFVEACKDKTMYSVVSYKKVYKRMQEMDPNINWTNLEKRYIAKYGLKNGQKPSRKMIIMKNDKLLEKFKRAVECLLVEM